MKSPQRRASRLVMRRIMAAYTNALPRSHITSRSLCSSSCSGRSKRSSAPPPNHNAPLKTKPPASPTIDVGGLLGLVELIEKLRAARNSEQQEGAPCPTEQFPPASRQGDPTDLGEFAAAQPQTPGGTTQQASGTPDGNGHKQHRHQPRGG